MSVRYVAVGWNRQKRIYDMAIGAGLLLYLAVFLGLGMALHPNATAETLLIRGLGTLALLLLHLILCIGPLARLDRRFLPLLYNRRHLGVSMFLVALAHGLFSLIQFHALGDVSPLASLLSGNTRYGSLRDFPFQMPGLLALSILFPMAATSHDFWLHFLTPPVWKRLHMMVYAAYAMLVAHVSLGALQSETSPVLAVVLGMGMTLVIGLHVAAGWKERRTERQIRLAAAEGFVAACAMHEIPDCRARVVSVGGERIAIFRQGEKISALSNVCAHQNGPLGEGRIVNGCVTCPWHGYQYVPETGESPPPFTERVAVFRTRVAGGQVFVHPVQMERKDASEQLRAHQ